MTDTYFELIIFWVFWTRYIMGRIQISELYNNKTCKLQENIKGVGALSPEIGPKFNLYYRAMKCCENVFKVMPFNKAYLKVMYI